MANTPQERDKAPERTSERTASTAKAPADALPKRSAGRTTAIKKPLRRKRKAIRVRATRTGYYQHQLYKEGREFVMLVPLGPKRGKVYDEEFEAKPGPDEPDFPSWVVDAKTPILSADDRLLVETAEEGEIVAPSVAGQRYRGEVTPVI